MSEARQKIHHWMSPSVAIRILDLKAEIEEKEPGLYFPEQIVDVLKRIGEYKDEKRFKKNLERAMHMGTVTRIPTKIDSGKPLDYKVKYGNNYSYNWDKQLDSILTVNEIVEIEPRKIKFKIEV